MDIVERSMSSEIYELLKRPDELYVVDKAHRNPRFVEDVVREMLRQRRRDLSRPPGRLLRPGPPGELRGHPRAQRLRRALRHHGGDPPRARRQDVRRAAHRPERVARGLGEASAVPDTLFVTGRLAADALRSDPRQARTRLRLRGRGPRRFGGGAHAHRVDRAAAARRTAVVAQVMIPGLCRGDLAVIEARVGVPVVRGPKDLKDLPAFFGQERVLEGYGEYDAKILAEIVEAYRMPFADILARPSTSAPAAPTSSTSAARPWRRSRASPRWSRDSRSAGSRSASTPSTRRPSARPTRPGSTSCSA